MAYKIPVHKAGNIITQLNKTSSIDGDLKGRMEVGKLPKTRAII